MALISSGAFNDLKALVKAECLRRAYVGNASGSVSVASYGGTSYDYSLTPAKDKIVKTEHEDKLIDPVAAINSDKVSGFKTNRIINQSELTQMTSFINTAKSNVYQSSTDQNSTNCKAGCTGLCYGCTGCTGCTDACTSCTNSCAQGCMNSCNNNCSGGCYGCGGCDYSCSGDCYGGCYGGCDDSCSSYVSCTCGSDCSVCSYNCEPSCVGSCSGGCDGSGSSCGSLCANAW